MLRNAADSLEDPYPVAEAAAPLRARAAELEALLGRQPMKLVYIAGPLSGADHWEIQQNVRRAAEVGFRVAKAGAHPVIPHTNTGALFVGTLTPEFWCEGTLELMRRCDAVVLAPGWMDSAGALAEREEAKRMGLPVFCDVADLGEWLDAAAAPRGPEALGCTSPGCTRGASHGGLFHDNGRRRWPMEIADPASAETPPVCGTCGGPGIVRTGDSLRGRGTTRRCPACTPGSGR